jgi:Spy/CpxP family protein refolding chaperone
VKPTTLLLAASLIANGALVALFLAQSASPSHPVSPSISSRPAGAADEERKVDALRAALASGDAAALAAAGVSPEIARELAIGRTFARMAERLRATQAKGTSEGPWWRPGSGPTISREQHLVARGELSDALITAFGDDFGLVGTNQAQLAFLPSEKRDALRRIVQDYDEMMAKFSAGGLQLASDREKLRLLRLERDRDISALLTPEERAAYEMRTSISGNTVKNRYGNAIESEAEFRKIFELQQAFDESYSREALAGRITPEVLRARSEAERQLEAKIRAAVGEERYAELRRAADPDVRTLDALANRLNLPAATTENVLASRDTYAIASQQIANNASLPIPDRRAQIQTLAAEAKSKLAQALGSEAAEAYMQRSPWINMLQNGMAYSTTPPADGPPSLPGGGQSVFPVMPAGAASAGAQRQVIINTAQRDGPINNDTVIGGSSVVFMPFTAARPGDSVVTSVSGETIRQRVVTPAPGPPAPPPSAVNPADPAPRP